MKLLSNEQRSRLEQIAESEFQIKWKEMCSARQKVFDDWYSAELAKVKRMPLIAKADKAFKEFKKLEAQITNHGIQVSFNAGNHKPTIRLINDSYDNRNYGKFKEMRNKAAITTEDSNAFTRAKNETLAIIWSMEQSFEACMKLIKQSVAKIK